MPGVQLDLKAVTFSQQRSILGREVRHDGVEALPESGLVHAGARQHILVDEVVQLGGHLQAVGGGAIGHGLYLGQCL